MQEEMKRRIAAADHAQRHVPSWFSPKDQEEWLKKARRWQVERPSPSSSSMSLTDPPGMVLCGPIRPSVRRAHIHNICCIHVVHVGRSWALDAVKVADGGAPVRQAPDACSQQHLHVCMCM